MASETKKDKPEEGNGETPAEKGKKKSIYFWFVVGVLIVTIGFGTYTLMKPKTTETTIAGIKIIAETPITDLIGQKDVFIGQQTDPSALTCAFEISAVSNIVRQGYRIDIAYGDTGVYIRKDGTTIRGRTPNDLLNACHAFLCARDQIECPDNFDRIKAIVYSAPKLNAVVDSNLSSNATRNYPELMGVLGYVQAQRADTNGDGVLNQTEISENTVYIFPYLQDGEICKLQNLNNLIENLNASNITRPCAEIPGIHVGYGKNRIELGVDKITITGDDASLHTASVIVRDAIAPEWIRVVYNMENTT
ncbi:Uncharacterised protein [uncultured archaeon]|nr:Uncharacterised protein [uncultured archaeon]